MWFLLIAFAPLLIIGYALAISLARDLLRKS